MVGDIFSFDEVKAKYPSVIKEDGSVDLEKLCLTLLTELSDIQDQLAEKDYQILRITEKLDNLR